MDHASWIELISIVDRLIVNENTRIGNVVVKYNANKTSEESLRSKKDSLNKYCSLPIGARNLISYKKKLCSNFSLENNNFSFYTCKFYISMKNIVL